VLIPIVKDGVMFSNFLESNGNNSFQLFMKTA